MNDLRILVKYVSKQKTKQLQVITDKDSFKGKSRILYDSILNGDINSDEDAQLLIYKNKDSENYRKLKYRLRQKLINTLFVVDVNQYGSSRKEKGEVNLIKTWAATEILTHRRLQGLSRRIQAQVLKTAIKLDRLDIAIPIAENQRKRYAITEYHQKKYEKYNSLVKSLTQQYTFQLEAAEYYTRLASIIGHKLKLKEAEKVNIKSSLELMQHKLSQFKNFNSTFFIYNAIYYLAVIDSDLSLKKSICDQALKYIDHYPTTPTKMHFSFKQKKALVLLEEGKLEQALTYLEDLKKINVKPGSISWQFVHNYWSLIHFTEKNYAEAYKIIVGIINNTKAFNNLISTFKEHWYIKEAYLTFLIAAGRLDDSKFKEKFKRPFRLNRFMNEVPQPSKDKVGYNLSIIIIQFFFILLKSDPTKTAEKLESLKQYSFRYLKGKEHVRSRTFIKLLQKLKNPLLDSRQIKAKSRILLKTLMDNPHDYSVEVMEREIIPYEQQWEELMILISTQRTKSL